MMACPNCGERLATDRAAGLIRWVCAACGGRALSITALRRVAGADFSTTLWRGTDSAPLRADRRCPACRGAMAMVAAGRAGEWHEVDVCRPCQFAWFDPGEFESETDHRRLAAPEPTPAQRDALRERVAIEQARRLGESARETDAEPDEGWKRALGYLGMPVELDAAELSRRPWITWALAAFMTVVSLVLFGLGDEWIERLAFTPGTALETLGVTTLTSFFVHGSAWHLLGNLYFLLVFGDNVEAALGHRRYALLLLLAVVGGDVLYALAGQTSPSVGASGGISGIIVFYALAFPHARLAFNFRLFWWFQLPAWAALALWLLYQGWVAYLQVEGLTKVSALHHLGGAALGLVAWLLWRRRA
jgi:membrane associated rhomboid family serine protease